MRHDTVYALSTGMGRAAVAIVRVSGPSCPAILKALCPLSYFLERRATAACIVDQQGQLIDRGIVIYFPAPRSFTGEDVLEFQVTGSRAVLAALLQVLSAFPCTRPAEPGEFTLRSFENGKRDLAEVEGLAAVVDAETVAQLRNAQRSASGELSRECENIREKLVDALALTEALLDFSDVEDPDINSSEDILLIVKDVEKRIKAMLQGSGAVERLRDGLVVVIAGPPNAGKSTLMNLLTKRDVSIVSPLPGTTRDLIEIAIDLEGFPIVLIDTAGLREPTDVIEAEGIARAIRKSETADLTLLLSSCSDPEEYSGRALNSEVVIKVKTKSDLGYNTRIPDEYMLISAKTGEGVSLLVDKIADFAKSHLGGAANSLIATKRQRAAVCETATALQRVIGGQNCAVEIVAEEIRFAARCMSRIVGRIDVEEVLGTIFSRLCVGK